MTSKKKEPNNRSIATVAPSVNSNKRIMSVIASEVITLRADWLFEIGPGALTKTVMVAAFASRVLLSSPHPIQLNPKEMASENLNSPSCDV